MTPARSGCPAGQIVVAANRDGDCSNPWCPVLMSKYLRRRKPILVIPRPGSDSHRITSRSGSSYRRERNSNAFAILKIEVFALMPIASDNTAASV